MAISTTPRSVSDATRFTSTTPHASSKSSAANSSVPSDSRFSRPTAGPGRIPGTPGSSGAPGSGGPGGPSVPPFGETPEQRVARLRAAHLAAKKAQVSRFDQVIARGRTLFDSAHKMTVLGLLGLTAIAGLMTVYTATDMIMYNRKRKAEFLEAQKQMATDSLEAARIAYMLGKATEDQIAMVDEANALEAGAQPGALRAPRILGAPTPAHPPPAAATAAVAVERASPPAREESAQEGQEEKKQGGGGGLRAWLFSNLRKEEEGEEVGSSQRRLGWESLSEEDVGAGVRDSDLARAVEDKQAYLREQARGAFERERENQRRGGPLDRVGVVEGQTTEVPRADPPKKKGWLW